MKYTLFNPSAPESHDVGPALNIGGSDDIYGASSIQTFSTGAKPLGATHADAQGFLDWYGRWNRGNFWFKDAGAKVWGYEETFDNWQDTYGMDAVRVFYHSGHGGMDSNGVFYAPLGAKWDGRDTAISSNMIIGNEDLRYLLWSTCQSLKVPDLAVMNATRKSPVDTWGPGNRGLRMIFGFHSNSLDSPHYGRNFGNNWNAGQSFSDAWINASWAISHNHICTVCAMGATGTEAQNRLFQERLFFGGMSSTAWYWWRWGGFENPVFGTVVADKDLPKKAKLLEFAPNQFDETRLAQLGSLFGFTKKQTDTLALGRDGSLVVVGSKGKQLTVDAEGRLLATLAPMNHQNTKALTREKAVEIAEKTVSAAGFRSDNVKLKFDSVRVGMAQGGTGQGSGTLENPYQSDTTVIFRQTAEGLSSINAGHGLVMITLDNDGTVTNIHNSTRPVANVSTQPRMLVNSPETDESDQPRNLLSINQEATRTLSEAAGQNFKVSRANQPIGAQQLESTVGYDFSGPYGTVVVNREYEVSAGGIFEKRYKVRIPIFA